MLKATPVDDLFGPEAQPGAFKYFRAGDQVGGINFVCPCGCGAILGISFVPPGPVWTWRRDEDRLTVSPSIRRLDGCGWHGYLRDGVWETC